MKKPVIALSTMAALCANLIFPVAAIDHSDISDHTTSIIPVNSIAPAASGYTYGPWFGGSTYNDQYVLGSTDTEASIAQLFVSALGTYLGRKISNDVAATLAGTAANIISMVISNTGNQTRTYYLTYSYRYREVYVAGEFAYFETEYKIDCFYNSARTQRVSGFPTVQILQGSQLASIDDNLLS